MRLKSLALVALLGLVSCRPYACWFPPWLSPEEELQLTGSGDFPKAPLKIVIDDIGVPHIFGQSDADLAYGLGFMHARDRLGQLVLTRAVATGRLSEILGDLGLSSDPRSRFFSLGVEKQAEALSDEDRALIDAYRAGMDDGAAHAGPTFEMTVLGLEWEPMSVLDVLAIARLQGSALSTGYDDELARARILNRIPEDDPRRAAFLTCPDPRGASVLRGEPGLANQALPDWPWTNRNKIAERPKVPERVKQLIDAISWRGGGGSNAWVLPGGMTKSGNATLSHDPHLAHQLPSLFYLAHLEGPDLLAAGATIPGLPFVGIGHGRDVAWGVPLSYVDTIDLVRISVDPNDAGKYIVDGESLAFETSEQTFRLGGGDDAEVIRETWRSTIFGPVLPESGFGNNMDEGDTFAMLWSPFLEPEAGARQLSSFWHLARAKTFDEAREAIEGLRVPPMSFTMAFTDGSVGFFPSAAIPLRASAAPTNVPRDGSKSDAGWLGFVPTEQKPQLASQSQLLVTANQALVPPSDPRTQVLGCDSAPSHRALRIHERLAELMDRAERPSTEELLAIQQDVFSPRTEEFGAAYAAACPASVEGVDEDFLRGFCEELRRFNGWHDVNNHGAIPFRAMSLFVNRAIAGAHVGDMELGPQLAFPVVDAIDQAVREYAAGGTPVLLDDPTTEEYDGLEHFVRLAMPDIYRTFSGWFGTSPSDWRYGRWHTRKLDTPLALAVPFVGTWLFGAGAYEETGCSDCVRAEGGFPVGFGAVLRMSAEMSSPPKVKFVIAGGQSGRLGHPHLDDQYVAWQTGTPFRVALTADELRGHVEGRVRISPR